MEVSHVWRRASKFPKKFFANVAFKTNNCQKKVSRVFRIQKTIKTQNKKLITWLRSSVFLTQSHCRLPTATCRPRQPPVDAERWQRHSWGSSHPCVESGSSQSVNAKRNEEQKNNKWIKNDDMCNSLPKVPKLATSAVVKPIFKLDDFIQGKSTRYFSRHSSTLVAFYATISWASPPCSQPLDTILHPSALVPYRYETLLGPEAHLPQHAANGASPSCLSWSQSSWPPYHQGSNEWDVRKTQSIWKNWIDLKKSKSWWNKLVKRRLQMITNAGAFLETVGATLRFRVWKWTMNDAATIEKKTRQKWSTKKGPAQGLSTCGKYDHKFWS